MVLGSSHSMTALSAYTAPTRKSTAPIILPHTRKKNEPPNSLYSVKSMYLGCSATETGGLAPQFYTER